MPFKSEAQRNKFKQLVKDGKMKQETLDQWEKETPSGKLPERIGSPKKNSAVTGKAPSTKSRVKRRFGQ